jgi:uncharacterized protein YbaR (Trm112 family)
MERDLMDILRCPDDKGQLELDVDEESDDGEVLEGTLTCTECGETYPIEGGIPNLLPADLQAEIDEELEQST